MSNEMMDLGFQNDNTNIQNNSMVEVAESRAMHEVQAAFVIAKKFPRNEQQCFVKIINACKRPYLAEQAMYAYPKGGTLVKGASIRLAESIAQAWGNLDCGIREVSQSNGVSVCEAYAIDLETNTRATKIFHVRHERHTKSGVTKLKDPRDIYELMANQGSRRLRACILAILPGDVTEAAVEQCNKTLETSEVPIADRIRKLITAFDEIGIKVEHLEKRLGHKMDATIPTEIVTLGTIYKSIKDGMADRSAFFDIGLKEASEDKINNLIENKGKKVISNKQDELVLDDKK